MVSMVGGGGVSGSPAAFMAESWSVALVKRLGTIISTGTPASTALR